MKMCIADQLAPYVNAVYGNYEHHNATSILLAGIFYFFQLYTDFCGYSHMAIGVGQILGLKIRENFNRPLFAQNIPELWRKWHMSLTTWITDYVFLPLNVKFRNWGIWGMYAATLINLVIVGAWHGANWTFVLFGLYHGILICITSYIEKHRKKFEKKHNLKNKFYWVYPRIFFTWFLFMIGSMLFRAESVPDYVLMMDRFFHAGFAAPFIDISLVPAAISIPILLFKEYNDEHKTGIHFLHSSNYWVKVISFAVMIAYIICTGALNGVSFIYFQF